jgi:hypothetical protein
MRPAALYVKIGLVLLAPLAAFRVTLLNVEPSIAVSATTERIEFTADRTRQLRWDLNDVRIDSDGGPAWGIPQPFSGSMTPAPGAKVVVERIAQGALHVTVTTDSGSAVTVQKPNFDSSVQLGSYVVFQWDSLGERARRGETITLPFADNLIMQQLGARVVVRDHPIGLLRSGRVALLKRSPGFLGGDVYVISTTGLEAGDELRFDQPVPVSGFISVDERPALIASVRVVTPKALIVPSGAQPRSLSAGFVDHVRNDTAIQTAWVLFLLFLGIAKAVGELRVHERGRKGHLRPRIWPPRK